MTVHISSILFVSVDGRKAEEKIFTEFTSD
jgi:hypothetical protein